MKRKGKQTLVKLFRKSLFSRYFNFWLRILLFNLTSVAVIASSRFDVSTHARMHGWFCWGVVKQSFTMQGQLRVKALGTLCGAMAKLAWYRLQRPTQGLWTIVDTSPNLANTPRVKSPTVTHFPSNNFTMQIKFTTIELHSFENFLCAKFLSTIPNGISQIWPSHFALESSKPWIPKPECVKNARQ